MLQRGDALRLSTAPVGCLSWILDAGGDSDALVGQYPCLPWTSILLLTLPGDCSGKSFWIMGVGLAACLAVGCFTRHPFNVVNRANVISTGPVMSNM